MDNKNNLSLTQSEIINRKYSFSVTSKYNQNNIPVGIHKATKTKIEQSREKFFQREIQFGTPQAFDLKTIPSKVFTKETKSFFSDLQNSKLSEQSLMPKKSAPLNLTKATYDVSQPNLNRPSYQQALSNLSKPTSYQPPQPNLNKPTYESTQSNFSRPAYQPAQLNLSGTTSFQSPQSNLSRPTSYQSPLSKLSKFTYKSPQSNVWKPISSTNGLQNNKAIQIDQNIKTDSTVGNSLEVNLIAPQPAKLKKNIVNNKKLGPPKYYIINNWNFAQIGKEQPLIRRGSIKDVDSLKETFEIFNMKGEAHEDLSLFKIRALMKKICVEDFSENSAIVLVVMTHGGTSSKLYAKDECFFLSEIVDPLLKNQHLNEKPKFIFIEACKGTTDPRMSMETNNSGSDMLIFYSAFENFVSYTDKDYGSYFTQSLCQKLKEKGKSKNIRDICDDVINDVIAKCGKIQTPTLTINLTRKYCFGDYCK